MTRWLSGTFPADKRRRLFRALAEKLDVAYGDQDIERDPAALAQVFKDATTGH